MDGVDAAAWTIDHYKQTLPTLSGRSHVIFIGNVEENRYSKMYLATMPSIVNLKGACFARDGSKAVVFGEGKFEQKAAFEELKEKLGYGTPGTLGLLVGSSFIATLPIVAVGAVGGLGYQALRYFKGKSEAKALR
ncbi:putative membrane protein [Pseudomonas syringae pv. cerasicola]|nr:putative membrane protein [Pseudomonas syringae pv. cerasicola]